jgi:hypothetical protein
MLPPSFSGSIEVRPGIRRELATGRGLARRSLCAANQQCSLAQLLVESSGNLKCSIVEKNGAAGPGQDLSDIDRRHDTAEIRWRGRCGGGAGLPTGLIIGGLVAAPRYGDGPYPTAPIAGPIGYGAPREAIAGRALARSIRRAVAGNPPLLSWRVPA